MPSVPTPRTPCSVCGGVLNPDCQTCIAEQIAREVASLGDLQELQED